MVISVDVDIFIALYQRPGQPVNFIAVIHRHLKLCIKREFTWVSEYFETLVCRDVHRDAMIVCLFRKVTWPPAVQKVSTNRSPRSHDIIDYLKAKWDGWLAILKMKI